MLTPGYLAGPPPSLAGAAINRDAVAVKALARVFKAWRLTVAEAARLAGVSDRTWSRMKDEGWSGSLSADQTTRASALIGIYKGLHLYFDDDLANCWVSMPNRGPLFGGVSPVQHMAAGGLLAIVDTRNYIDAIRGGV